MPTERLQAVEKRDHEHHRVVVESRLQVRQEVQTHLDRANETSGAVRRNASGTVETSTSSSDETSGAPPQASSSTIAPPASNNASAASPYLCHTGAMGKP